jgi:hypothetical protein
MCNMEQMGLVNGFPTMHRGLWFNVAIAARLFRFTKMDSEIELAATAALSSLGHKLALALVEYRMAAFASVEAPQHIDHEEDQQYGSQSYARTATITPAAMAVVPPTTP